MRRDLIPFLCLFVLVLQAEGQTRNFTNRDLSNFSFRGANLDGADFTGATIAGTDFRHSSFSREQLESTASYERGDLQEISFLGTWNLRGADFSGQNLTGVDFSDARLDGANFSSANLTDVLFAGSRLPNVTFSGANLSNAEFRRGMTGNVVDLQNTNFVGSILSGAKIKVPVDGVDFANAIVTDADLGRSNITQSQLESTASYQERDLSGTRLPSTVELEGKDLRGWSLDGANLPNLRNAQLNGADLSNAWLLNDLSGADLTDANIKGVRFDSESNLSEAQFKSTASYQSNELADVQIEMLDGWDLSGRDLTGAVFRDATDTNFAGSKLTNAGLGGLLRVDLSGAELQGARLAGTFSNVVMTGADLTDANFIGTWPNGVRFDQVDLRTVNLDRIRITSTNTFRGANLTGLELPALPRATVLTNAIINDVTFGGISEVQLQSTKSFQDKDLRGVGLVDVDTSGWNLSGQDLSGGNLGAVSGMNLRGANLTGLAFRSDMEGTDLTDANISRVELSPESKLGEAQLRSTASFQAKDLSGVRFGTNINGWDLSETDLSDALVFGDITDTDLSAANIKGASFGRLWKASNLSEEQFKSTASYQLNDLGEIRIREDLSGWDLSGLTLINADFGNSKLFETQLTDSTLTGASFWGSDIENVVMNGLELEGAEFVLGSLTGVDLRDANVNEANFFGTIIIGADFTGADLRDVSMVQAQVSQTTFEGANLSGATMPRLLSDETVDLTDAVVNDTSFAQVTEEQLRSTKSYKDKNLQGIRVSAVDLSGWDLSNQDLRGAALGSDLDGLDLRGANLKLAIIDAENLRSIVVDSTTTYDQWTVFSGLNREFDPNRFGATLQRTQSGDFDANNRLDADDIADLQALIRVWDQDVAPVGRPQRFDLNEDGMLNDADTSTWLELANTTFGDANLDGQVDFADFLVLSVGFGESGSWSDGDFDGDGELAFSDFLLLADNFGKDLAINLSGPSSSVSAVPEARGSILCQIAILLFVALIRSRKPKCK